MGVLTSGELTFCRQGAEAERTFAHTKGTIDAALQAMEDEWETNTRTAMSSAIDTAISPATMTNTEKKTVGKWWMRKKFDLGG